MNDRDTFAAAALTGLLAAPTDKDRSSEYWARFSYEIADAMLAVRDSRAANEPVAWAALRDDGDIAWIGYTPEGAADGACGRRIVPLYRHPAPAVTAEPVAWWLRGTEYDTGYEYVSLVREIADAAAKEGGTVTPLYRAPTLTDEEREAVLNAARAYELDRDEEECAKIADTLRKLLERLGGGR